MTLIAWIFRSVTFGSSKAYRMVVIGLLMFEFTAYPIVFSINYYRIVNALNTGSCDILQGRVTNFRPRRGSGLESVDINGRNFEYSHHKVSLGFSRDSALGGPIREGLLIKAYAVGDIIVRLEVEELPQ
jgi:hypothetical protein